MLATLEGINMQAAVMEVVADGWNSEAMSFHQEFCYLAVNWDNSLIKDIKNRMFYFRFSKNFTETDALWF